MTTPGYPTGGSQAHYTASPPACAKGFLGDERGGGL